MGPVTADPVRAEEAAPAPPARARADEARRLWTGMISVAAAGLLLGALVLAVPGLHDVLARIEGIDPGWIRSRPRGRHSHLPTQPPST